MILPSPAAANTSPLQAFTFPARLKYCSHDNVSVEIHSRALRLLIDGAMSQMQTHPASAEKATLNPKHQL